jgi:hypothetical protein
MPVAVAHGILLPASSRNRSITGITIVIPNNNTPGRHFLAFYASAGKTTERRVE